MSAEKIDTLVVGCGQAGLAMSEHLGKNGIPHLVLCPSSEHLGLLSV